MRAWIGRSAVYTVVEFVGAADAGCAERYQGDYAEEETDVFETVEWGLVGWQGRDCHFGKWGRGVFSFRFSFFRFLYSRRVSDSG